MLKFHVSFEHILGAFVFIVWAHALTGEQVDHIGPCQLSVYEYFTPQIYSAY